MLFMYPYLSLIQKSNGIVLKKKQTYLKGKLKNVCRKDLMPIFSLLRKIN